MIYFIKAVRCRKGLEKCVKKINEKKNHAKLEIVLFCGSIFIVYFFWSILWAFDNAPDEQGRYAVAKFIFQNHKLPYGNEEEIRVSIWGFSYAFQPYLSYIISAFFMQLVSCFTNLEYWYIVAARFTNVLLGTTEAFFVFKLGEEIFEEKYEKWLFVLSIILLPQNMFMFIYVNTDGMALTATAMIVYAWVRGLKYGWNRKNCFLLSVGVSLCLLSYYNAYGYVLTTMLILFIGWIKNPDEIHFKTLFSVVSEIFIMAGWWFIRSFIIYNGDFLGLKTRNYYAQLYAAEHLKPLTAHTYKNANLSVFYMLKNTNYVKDMWISFIGKFGNMSENIPVWIYFFVSFVIIGGIIGSVRFFKRKKEIYLLLCLLVNIMIPIVLATYSAWSRDYQAQGRYVLPILIPLMIIVNLGLKEHIHNKKIYGCLISLYALEFVCFYLNNVVLTRAKIFFQFIPSLLQ